RGFFINNEDMMTGSFRDPLDENLISPYHFDKICELILRLHGNTIAPGTRVYPDETARDNASQRGLYVNDHHVTPLGLNVYAWPRELPFSYITHPEILEEMWKKCIDAQKHRKMLWTVSFRGKGDGPFWHVDRAAPADDAGRADVISRAVAKQVELIREVQPHADIIFNMYYEQAELYKKGLLKIPEGVIKVWPNDGAGILSDGGQAGAGDGAYYHITACRNRVCEAVSPETCYRELGKLKKNGGNGCIIINIGNIRPFPVSISTVMDFAYRSDRYLEKAPAQQMEETILQYAKRHYDACAQEVSDIYTKFFRCSNFRRPQKDKAPFGYGDECLGMYAGMWRHSYNQVLTEFRQSLYMHEIARKYIKVVKGEEKFTEIWVKTVDDFNSILQEDEAYLPTLSKEAEALFEKIPPRSKDLYLQNVLVPIHAINHLNLAMEHEGLSLKAYFAGNKEEAICEMEQALAEIEQVFHTFHRGESAKWHVWYKNECLACYPHTHDLIACVLSLLKGEGEIIVRPFVDFSGHNKHVSLYQHKRGNANFPYLHKH
ncbi:MAG: glycosyl hydrolase 115 family protein, partial [Clostridia bacterium]|nr:glycosyl hydrolase 115 family protein [Clostridia bacterium]